MRTEKKELTTEGQEIMERALALLRGEAKIPQGAGSSSRSASSCELCLLCGQGTDTRRDGIPLCPSCADLPEAPFLAPYRDTLRQWWAGDALAIKERRRNPDWPEIHQELIRLQDELGFEKARDLRMKWAEEWHRETGICPHCGEPGPYHDPYGESVERG